MAPTALSKAAVVEDWPRFNGLSDNAKSLESPLLQKWPAEGPSLVWSLEKGDGYASPAIMGDILVLFHRINGQEVAEGRNAISGAPLWEYSYPVDYQDRYGYSAGPRASPVIFQDRVYLHGVTAWLTCLNLKTGELIWTRDLTKEYKVPVFFSNGSSISCVFDEFKCGNIASHHSMC